MIAITGATGQTGSKIADLLLDAGKKIRVLGRSEENLRHFKERGAEIAVGNQENLSFLTKALKGCEAVYLLIPRKMDTNNIILYYDTLGDVAVQAIQKSGIKKVVFLSSLGAELDSGTGPVVGLHNVEAKLAKLAQTDIVFLRVGAFMENILMNASLIKNQHINGNAILPDAPVAMVATKDIARKASELLAAPTFTGHRVVDLFGDRITYKEATTQIGEAIGIPELPYVQFSDADAVKGMMGMGLSKNMAESYAEMSSAISKGLIIPTQIDPLKPNAATSFREFANEVMKPALQKAA
jgi:uncharacterized protein YbjT (DUF2867 family)